MKKLFRCPICKTPLTKRKYQQALGVVSDNEHHTQHLLNREKEKNRRSLKALADEKKDLRLKLQKTKSLIGSIKDKTTQSERARAKRIVAGQKANIDKLKRRLKNFEKGNTPQDDGLAFEKKLAHALRKVFREDQVEHTGKCGDVFHSVRFEGKIIGTIVYECKRTDKITGAHIRQTYLAKLRRKADFGVLVTTGSRRGFGGFCTDSGISIAAPTAVLPLVALLRKGLIEISRTNMQHEKKAGISKRLLDFIGSKSFRAPIEDIVQNANNLKKDITREIKAHRRQWENRWEAYSRIENGTLFIDDCVNRVLQGKTVKAVENWSRHPVKALPSLK